MQVTGVPPVQTPFSHVSTCVQASPSEHGDPFALAGFEHAPVAGSQVPASWHWSVAVQVTGVPPVQTPAWQVSPVVQALPSLHVVPSVATGFEHAPVAGSHVPATCHWSVAVQVTGVPPVQTPFSQVSTWVQASPSEQGDPFALAGFEHAPVAGSQVPASWH